MLGWWIDISNKEDESLANWFANLFGIDWLNKLVEEGVATCEQNNGFPNKYLTTAGVVLPILQGGVPRSKSPPVIGEDYVLPADWLGSAKLRFDLMARCKPDDPLIIEAWDQS